MLLVNHALARGTPAIFVIFVVSWGLSSKTLVLLVRMQIRHFRHFRQKPPFSGGTKARFTKSTVFGTPNMHVAEGKRNQNNHRSQSVDRKEFPQKTSNLWPGDRKRCPRPAPRKHCDRNALPPCQNKKPLLGVPKCSLTTETFQNKGLSGPKKP